MLELGFSISNKSSASARGLKYDPATTPFDPSKALPLGCIQGPQEMITQHFAYLLKLVKSQWCTYFLVAILNVHFFNVFPQHVLSRQGSLRVVRVRLSK